MNPSLIRNIANSRRLQRYLATANLIVCSEPGGNNVISFEDFAASRYLFMTGEIFDEETKTLNIYYFELSEDGKRITDEELAKGIVR